MSSSLLTLRPHHYYPSLFPLSFPSSLKSFSLFSSLSLNPIPNQSQTLTLDPSRSLNYGPSLSKGINPNPNANPSNPSCPERSPIDRSQFSRAFDIAALRVPAADCSALECRLRGHLLNWPRVRNVARVDGDDIDPDLKDLLSNSPAVSKDRLNSLDRRRSEEEEKEAFSSVLYRERLVKDFNCRGYLKFRNLAKISRPKKKKKKKKSDDSDGKERRGKEKDEVYVVEVVGDDDEDDWGVLIGEGFKGGKWSGPTRLLLLDERYARKGMDEMPEAIKVCKFWSLKS